MTKEEAKEYWTVRYEAARNWDDPHWEASERKDHRRYVDALKTAIEALSERTGEWICRGDYAMCSKCGGLSDTQFDGVERIPKTTAFCPHCGAKMCKGGDEE